MTAATAAIACLSFLANRAEGNPVRPDAPDQYRLRISNCEMGGVFLTGDGGKTWSLVARVTRPAFGIRKDGAPTPQGVAAVARDKITLSTGGTSAFTVEPDSQAGRGVKSAILLNAKAGDPLFSNLAPPTGSTLRIDRGSRSSEMPDGYSPLDQETYLITFGVPPTAPTEWSNGLAAATLAYRQAALARLKSAKGSPVTGILTVEARPPEDDQSSCVTFLRDGATLALMNRAPYRIRWNTRDWPDGEYLVEARGLDRAGSVALLARKLIYVQNHPE